MMKIFHGLKSGPGCNLISATANAPGGCTSVSKPQHIRVLGESYTKASFGHFSHLSNTVPYAHALGTYVFNGSAFLQVC